MNNKAVFLDLQGTLGGDGLGDVRDFEFFSYSIEVEPDYVADTVLEAVKWILRREDLK